MKYLSCLFDILSFYAMTVSTSIFDMIIITYKNIISAIARYESEDKELSVNSRIEIYKILRGKIKEGKNYQSTYVEQKSKMNHALFGFISSS